MISVGSTELSFAPWNIPTGWGINGTFCDAVVLEKREIVEVVYFVAKIGIEMIVNDRICGAENSGWDWNPCERFESAIKE